MCGEGYTEGLTEMQIDPTVTVRGVDRPVAVVDTGRGRRRTVAAAHCQQQWQHSLEHAGNSIARSRQDHLGSGRRGGGGGDKVCDAAVSTGCGARSTFPGLSAGEWKR